MLDILRRLFSGKDAEETWKILKTPPEGNEEFVEYERFYDSNKSS